MSGNVWMIGVSFPWYRVGIFTYISPGMWAFFTRCRYINHTWSIWDIYSMPFVFLSLGFGRRVIVRNSWRLASEPWKFSTRRHLNTTWWQYWMAKSLQTNCPNDSGKTEILSAIFLGPETIWRNCRVFSQVCFLLIGRFQMFQDLP